MSPIEPFVVDFAVKQLGGEEAIKKMYYDERIGQVIKTTATIKEISDIAKKEGWLDLWQSMTISDLLGSLRGRQRAQIAVGERLTPAQLQNLRDAVLVALKDKAWTGKTEIATSVGVEARKLNSVFKGLKKDGMLKTHGSGRHMVYALAGTRTRPE